jgi:hypothetical protein
MTYHRKHALARAPRQGLGGLLDDIITGIVGGSAVTAVVGANAPCLAAANAKAAPLDQRRYALAKDWAPSTNVFKAAELYSFVSDMFALVSSASSLLASAPLTVSDAESAKQNALNDLWRQTSRGQVYVTAYRDAVNQHAIGVNAPGLKKWVLDTLGAVSHAVVTAGYLSCNMSFLANAVMAFQAKFDIVASVAKRLVNLAIKAGDAVLTIADGVLDFAPLIKWGGLAVGALFVYRELKDRRMIP